MRRMAATGTDADVVVVGGGSAGCAAAHRLVRAGLGVLLVEAGPDYGPAGSGRWPAELLDPRWLPTSHDWGWTERRPDGREVAAPRARVLGGCSTHNQCGAWWGLPGDYDRWARLTGDRRWSWRALRPWIDQIEDARGGDAHRGHGGLVATRAGPHAGLTAWQGAFLEAARAAGYPPVDDLSGAAAPDAAAPYWVNVAGGRRVNSAAAFLDPVRGASIPAGRPTPNLQVVDRALADRLVVEQGRAVALVCRRDGAPLELTAGWFVLAGGAYGSPAVLLRSGIGPAAHLAALGIPTAIDLPGVGANLHDHPGAALAFAPSAAAVALLDEELAGRRSCQSQVLLRARGGRLHLFPYQSRRDDGGWRLELDAFVLAPRSRGRLRLRSPDPAVPPRIDLGFLSDAGGHDQAALRRGVALARELVRLPPVARMCEQELSPAASALPATGRLRPGPAAAAWLRQHVGGYGHPVGTCRMGHRGDPAAVADAEGLVAGTGNVVVADASAIPLLPHAGTNLTAMLVGWCVAGRLARRLGAPAR
jgi:choline dehydrogenase